jgi:thiol-disulfide isomerase/thioredoxin
MYTSLAAFFILAQAIQTSRGQSRYQKKSVDPAPLTELIKAVEAAPDNIKAHEVYIDAVIFGDTVLTVQYNKWMGMFPKSATVPFAIGRVYANRHNPKSGDYLLKAVQLNPSLAEAWNLLSSNASLAGNDSAAMSYMQHATQSAPENPDYAFYYALLHKNGDAAKYDSLMTNMVYHFPTTERAAEALYYLAYLPYNTNEKTAYYETLYSMFSDKESAWFRTGMIEYYDYLLNTSPDKAFDLALKMVLKVKTNRQDWKQRIMIARNFIEAKTLINSGKPDSAVRVLKKIDLNNKIMGRPIDAEEQLALFKAEAADAGNKTRAAYDSLSMFYSKRPTDNLHTALVNLASKLGMNSADLDAGIWKIRNSQASQQKDFSLESYNANQSVKLSAYRGKKVVLVTYWFPSCGPCNEELPHFEAALKNVDTSKIAFLAINIDKSEDAFVLPLKQAKHYSFTPLRDGPALQKGGFPVVRVVPSSFLIDQNGRVIFSDFTITGNNEHTLELMINEVLKFGGKTPKNAKATEVSKPSDSGALAQTKEYLRYGLGLK